MSAAGTFRRLHGHRYADPRVPWVTERMEEKYCWKNDSARRSYRRFPRARRRCARTRRTRGHGDACHAAWFEASRTGTKSSATTSRWSASAGRSDDPPRYPLVGPAWLHHCHWKCTVYYTETFESGYPFPFRCKKPRIEVVYIDKDHLHVYNCPDPQVQQSLTRDVAGP